MAETIAALIVRIATDTTEMVTGAKKASDELDKLENHVEVVTQKMAGQALASRGVSGSVGELTSVYRQFDGVLQSAGVNIGPYVKGLEDIANTSGKSAAGVGALGTAGLALGAGIAGWNIGRAIAEFFDLDRAIANSTASLMGYGDMVAEVSGAKQDVINRAIAAGARETISYTQSVQFLLAVELQRSDAYAVSSTRLADAQRELRGLSAATIEAIGVAQQNGATVEQMSRHFNLSADALRVLAERQREAAQSTGEHTKQAEALQKSYEKLISDVRNAKGMALFESDADNVRRGKSNQEQLDLMERDARLQADRRAFDDNEAIETGRQAWERNYFAEQEQINRDLEQMMLRPPSSMTSAPSSMMTNAGRFASVVNPPSTVTINAQGSFFNNPDSINQLARLVEDAIARRSSLSGPYTRR